jgi:hypothetical protein
MPPRRWVFDPGSGGVKIKEATKRRTEDRIRRYAEKHFGNRYTRLDIRFRGQFCYVDAYTEPASLDSDWPPLDWPESREEYLKRLRNTPVHLFRLRYFGNEDSWGLAFYSYAHEKYELSVFPTGEFMGTPEEAFQAAGEFHL